jgi:hypothetical protein
VTGCIILAAVAAVVADDDDGEGANALLVDAAVAKTRAETAAEYIFMFDSLLFFCFYHVVV